MQGRYHNRTITTARNIPSHQPLYRYGSTDTHKLTHIFVCVCAHTPTPAYTSTLICCTPDADVYCVQARLAQSAERKVLNLVVVGSSPTVGVSVCAGGRIQPEL